jgi:uncharacterized protein
MAGKTHRNRLAEETSPYLLQHADNPVDWYPWCAEALEHARAEDRPILLSIGYSACHWCHVMAHESFEDAAIAGLMNRYFVNIKVDREERPDLDRIYQTAHQLITRRPGGWPLTMFLDPRDQTPFFGGTYFPPKPRHGMPAFPELLRRVAEAWQSQHENIRSQGAQLREMLGRMERPRGTGAVPPPAVLLGRAFEALESEYDPRFGGFGSAPKFPHPSNLELLLFLSEGSHGAEIDRRQAARMLEHSLRRMSESGLFDQLGGGWYRYSVDPYWMIPHFEKMLYDNGPLLTLAAELGHRDGDGVLRRAVVMTVNWLQREMRHPEGGLYATLDADSEGGEGAFYAWDREEIRALLPEEEYAIFARRFGLDREPNFESRWHLHAFAPVAGHSELDEAVAEARLESARRRLFEAREARPRPARDEKILTAWNGLAISGLARAARRLELPEAGEMAAQAADFVLTHLRDDAGHLSACWKGGLARFPAYLDDYAFLARGLLELLQWRWSSRWLDAACGLADRLLADFEDRKHGGFLFTAHGHERLIHRPRPLVQHPPSAPRARSRRHLVSSTRPEKESSDRPKLSAQ